MSQFTRYIALFLLLLFARVMMPDGIVLNLHSHEHTEHAASNFKQNPNLAKVDTEHSHCPIEDLFGASFQGSLHSPEFIFLAHTSTFLPGKGVDIQDISFSSAYLRGPPAV